MKKLLLPFFILYLVVFCSHCYAADRTYAWRLEVDPFWGDDAADTNWTIKQDSIDFQAEVISAEIFICYIEFIVLQESRQFKFASFFPGENQALFIPDDYWSGCDTLKKGVKVSAVIKDFPSWFNTNKAFTIFWESAFANDLFLEIPDNSNPTTSTTVNNTTTTIPNNSTTTTTISSGSCPAEAIYGENSEQTELLRKYRDNVLSKTPEGQEMIKTYYKLSPAVSKLLEQRPLLKNRAKAFIDSMLPGLRKKIEESQSKNQ